MFRSVSVSILACVCAACLQSQDVRRVTYPPDFRYVTEGEIRSTMGQLAVQMRALESLMMQSETPLPSDHQRVTEILTTMQALARDLTRGQDTHHPDLNRYAPVLEQRIDRALFAVRRTPPNYFFAGTISGACEYCHAPRHRAALPRALAAEPGGRVLSEEGPEG